jgi:hypothetical protein
MTRRKEPVCCVGDYFMTPEQFRTVRETFQWLEVQVERTGTHECRWKMDTLADILYAVKQHQQVKE